MSRDLRFALRSLRRSPGFALAAVLTLALGIGANTAIFSVVHGVLLRPLPYENGDELVLLRQGTPESERIPFSIAEFFDYRQQLESLDLVEHHSMSFTLLGRGEPERVSTGVVSHDFFSVLGVKPLHGRFFHVDDEVLGAEAVLVLAHDYWQRSFGGDPDIVGEVFEMNNRPHTVIGVLPSIPQFPTEHDLYMPSSACPFRAAGQERMHENRSAFRNLEVFGRLRSGVDRKRATADAETVLGRFLQDHPDTYDQATGLGIATVPLREELTREARPMILVLLATTGLVLLLACTNVANLTLARLLGRQRELAVRASLGAGKGQIVAQTALESTLVALAGGVLGVGVAYGGVGLLRGFMARFTPRAETMSVDSTVLAFALGLALLTGLVLGVAPVLRQRTDLVRALREGAGSGQGTAKVRLRGALVAAQVAVSVVLLVGAGLLLRSFAQLQNVDPGFDPENVVSAQVPLNWTRYDTQEKWREFYEQLVERLGSHPGVLSAAAGSVAPLTQAGTMSTGMRVENVPVEEGRPEPSVDLLFVTPEYFPTLEIPRVRGRFFDRRDHADAPGVAIISRALARRHFGDRDPVGRRISVDQGQSWIEVVGVVGDVLQFGLDREAGDAVYLPLSQTGFSNRVLVRTRSDPESMSGEIRAAVHSLDPDQPVESIQTMAETRRRVLETPRTTTSLLALFAALALLITAAGVGSVVAYSVGQRTREIGVRVAMGARPGEVVALVMRQGLGMVALGVAIGLLGALAFGNLIADLLFRVGSRDPITFVTVAGLLLLVAAAACLEPARRALRVDPSRALRAE
ncbi:MAG: ABC transporter permease [Holophagales bacterium]|nr:ABC transporter permease [Holophagales bacterium]